MSLSRAQNGKYRPLVKKAYHVYCASGGNDLFDPWYRKQLVNSLGVHTTKQLKTAGEFDQACLHFATLAGDAKEIDHWSRASERRALWVLEQSMRKLDVGWPYVKGVARNLGFGDRPIRDLPATLILKINTALDKQVRRKEKKKKEEHAQLQF